MPWARKKSVVHGIFYLLLQICILEREEEVTMRGKRKILWGTMTLLLVLALSTMTVFAADGAEEYVPDMYATFWSLIPPVVAIVLALITKEVYSSLFIGILIGGVFYSGFQFERTITHVFQDGIVGVLSDSYNVGILVFLVILGIMVCMMNKAGGSAAFGRWASEHIKSRIGAQLATILLGVLIFIDDYFNCLTVGSVMRPVTDKHNVSRAKLSYLIDATAAPVCIIAPISSWAAAVTGFVEGESWMESNEIILFAGLVAAVVNTGRPPSAAFCICARCSSVILNPMALINTIS